MKLQKLRKEGARPQIFCLIDALKSLTSLHLLPSQLPISTCHHQIGPHPLLTDIPALIEQPSSTLTHYLT